MYIKEKITPWCNSQNLLQKNPYNYDHKANR
jgi:hypothetical protein